jgi:DNA-binding IclR family transcriptional regulator
VKSASAVSERPQADGDLVTWMAGTQLLARAVSLILYLRERDEPVTVVELAGALKIPANTAYRLVRTLELGGFVDRTHRPYVSLGLRLMDLGQAKQREVTRELAPVALPVLETLTADTGETSLLLMPTGARAICILSVEPSRAIRLSYQPGRVLPLYAGASGKVTLPWLSAHLLETALAQAEGQVLADGRRLTASSLRDEVEAIRESGHCVTHDELDAGASAVGAPVFTRGGQLLASVSIAGPRDGFSDERLPTLVDQVVAAASRIGDGLARAWAAAAQERS